MTAKQWLNRGRKIDEEIDKLIESRVAIMDRLTSITQNYDSDGSQATKDPHKYDKLVEFSGMIDERTDQLVAVKKEITAVINQLPDRRQRLVLMSYYIDGKTWEQTAVDLHYSWRQVMRIHGHALYEIKNVIECHIGHML